MYSKILYHSFNFTFLHFLLAANLDILKMPTRQDRNTFNDLCFVMIKVKFSSFLKNRDSYKTVVATLFVWWAEKLPPKSSGAQKCVQNNLADKLLRTISTLIMYLFIKCCIIFNNVKMMLLKKTFTGHLKMSLRAFIAPRAVVLATPVINTRLNLTEKAVMSDQKK